MSFVSNIPHSIFNNFLLMGVLWIAYQLLERFFKGSAKQSFAIGTFIQFFATITFIVDLFTPEAAIDHVPNLINVIIANTPASFIFYIGIIYCLGLFIYLIHFVYQIQKINTLKQSGNFTSQHQWMNLLADTKINLPVHLKIGVSNKINSPMVFGFLEPIILLPLSICNHLSNEEIKLILIHELAHIIRNDYFINLLVSISKIILWFNPFSYLISNKIVLLRELACDEFVIQHTHAPIVYSKALYQLALNAQEQIPDFAMGAVNNMEHELIIRIKNINKLSDYSFNYLKFTLITLTFITTAFLGSMLIGNVSKINKANKISATVILKQPSANSNDNVVKTKSSSSNLEKNNAKKIGLKKVLDANDQLTNVNENEAFNTVKSDYDKLINETRTWIKQREIPAQFANYSSVVDSLDNIMAERLLITSIIKSYQLKRTIIAQKLAKAQDENEAFDYIVNSKEWSDIIEYEKWAEEFLGRRQQRIGLPPTTTKQQIQY